MATAMTYTTLLADLRSYLERGYVTDTVVYDQLPSLINLAERDIATKLKILGLINVVTSALAAGVSVYAKPDRWRSTVSIRFGGGVDLVESEFLYPRPYEYLRKYWPNPATRDVPEFYADYDYAHWLIAPTPDLAYPYEVIYYQQPPLLDVVNQTNWLTDYAPQLLLYSTLLQCTPFLKNDERIPTWQGLYDDQMQAMGTQDLQRIVDRTTTRQEN
jgi:hypothetical protein